MPFIKVGISSNHIRLQMRIYIENAHNTILIRNELSLIQYDVFYQIKALYLLEEKAPTLTELFDRFKGKARKALRFVLNKYFREENGHYINDEFEQIIDDERKRLEKKNRKSEKCRQAANARWHGQKVPEDANASTSQKVERTVTDANASSKKTTVHANASTSKVETKKKEQPIDSLKKNASASVVPKELTKESVHASLSSANANAKNPSKSKACSSRKKGDSRACVYTRARVTELTPFNSYSVLLSEEEISKALDRVYRIFESWGFVRKHLVKAQEALEVLIAQGLTDQLVAAGLRKAKEVKERRHETNFRYCVNYAIKVIENTLHTWLAQKALEKEQDERKTLVEKQKSYVDKHEGLCSENYALEPSYQEPDKSSNRITDEMFEIIFHRKRTW